jgi:hypothetical protein
MRNIKNFGEFVNESKENKVSITQFVHKLTNLSKSLLNKLEKREDHFIHDFILAEIYSIYDDEYENKEEITSKDYDKALATLKGKLEEYRKTTSASKGYKKSNYEDLEKLYKDKLEKQKQKKAEREEKFKQQEEKAGRPYTPPADNDDDDDDDEEDD